MARMIKMKLIRVTAMGAALVLISILVTGMMNPAWAAERKLAFAVGGVVEQVLVRVGQKVEAGAPLARLDPRPFQSHRKASTVILKSAATELRIFEKKRQQEQELYDDLSTSRETLEAAVVAEAKVRASHAKAQARADSAAWRLERATLRAPATGTVRAVPGYRGMVVNPNAAIVPVVILDIP